MQEGESKELAGNLSGIVEGSEGLLEGGLSRAFPFDDDQTIGIELRGS
jgi:hypothetical protein